MFAEIATAGIGGGIMCIMNRILNALLSLFVLNGIVRTRKELEYQQCFHDIRDRD